MTKQEAAIKYITENYLDYNRLRHDIISDKLQVRWDLEEARGEEHPKTPRAFSGTPLRQEARGERQEVRGRHDACVAVRAVPVVEAMAAMVLADWHDF